MGKKGGGKIEVTDYCMSQHWGFCWGPVDALLNIYAGEKECWAGNETAMNGFSVNRPDLYGGNKKEGGVQGNVWFLPGKDDQILTNELAGKLGLTSTTAPGFRGLTSLFFIGSTGSTPVVGGGFGGLFGAPQTGGGFMWGSNTPYQKSLWGTFRRSPKGLNSAYRMIGNLVTVSINGYAATVDAATATLVDGVAQSVGGHTIAIDYNGVDRTVTVDGVVIEIVKSSGKFTITIDGEERTDVRPGATVNIYGVSITVTDTTTAVTIGSVNGTDANPVHIIYECLTNTDWGMGASSSIINVASFEAAGQTVFNESLGLSLAWMASSTIEAFITEIIDHILATVFVNPSDGLITIKLIRDDYDRASLPELNPDNCEVLSFDRKLWGETTNEIVVTWTNPVSEKEETVTVQDLANCAIQGGVVSDSRNYYGVRNAALAQRLAIRDIRTASAPLASFDIEVDRSAWNFVPGGCVRLVYPEDGIEDVVLRIGKIDYGKAGAATIRVSAMEDIFAQPVAAYTVTQSSQWTNPASAPEPMEYVRLMTMPHYFADNTVDITDAEYPDVMVMVLAASTDTDTLGYSLIGIEPSPNGQPVAEDYGHRSTVSRALLSSTLPAEYKSTIDGTNLTEFVGPIYTGVNSFVVIGDAAESAMEIALVSESTTDGIVIQRGLLDTVPRDWPADTPMWFFPGDLAITDTTIRAEGETAEFKLLTETSMGILPIADAPIKSVVLTARPWLPNRPGNVKIGDVGFGSVQMGTAASIPVTWANRNRLMEPTEVIKWSDGNVTPEAGQTTKITVMKSDRTVLTVHAGLTGTSFDLPAASFVGEAAGIVRVTAVRDGLESLQGHEIIVTLTPRGYGTAYGSFYGGAGGGSYVPIDPPTPDPTPDPTPIDPWDYNPDAPWVP